MDIGGLSQAPVARVLGPSCTIIAPEDWSAYDERTTQMMAEQGVSPEQPVRHRTMTGTYVDFPSLSQVPGGDRRLVAALVSIMGSTTLALDDARQEIVVLNEEVSELKKARANDAMQ
jgi:hypothetical protein